MKCQSKEVGGGNISVNSWPIGVKNSSKYEAKGLSSKELLPKYQPCAKGVSMEGGGGKGFGSGWEQRDLSTISFLHLEAFLASH